MKYKVGDKVRIKSIDWYNKNKTSEGCLVCGSSHINPEMICMLGKTVTISSIEGNHYRIKEYGWNWTDDMIEGLVEEDNVHSQWTGLKVELELSKTVIGVSNVESLRGERFMSGFVKAIIPPEGYQFVDENGNVINATKIVLEKKHNDKLKLESIKKVREYWSEYARIYIEIYDNEPNECVLTHLYTLEGHRQKGYGRQALIEAESIAKELGCHTAYLKVETDSWMHQWYLRMGYKWYKTADKEYTWLTKNLTVLEKKKKKYPKTYEECCKVLNVAVRDFDILYNMLDTSKIIYSKNLDRLLNSFRKLLICRDAYWKIAGEEMGLGKPWELSIGIPIYYIYYNRTLGTIKKDYADDIQGNVILAFPTEEMRDAFYENFKKEIEICKELL